MQQRVSDKIELAKKLRDSGNDFNLIIDKLYFQLREENEPLFYSIIIKVLDRLGLTQDQILSEIDRSELKDYTRSAEDLFFDAIELDDDVF